MRSRILSILMVTATSVSICMAGDWPQFRGPDRSGISSETGLLRQWPEGGPELLWKYEGLGKGYASVSVAKGLIYTTGVEDGEGYIYAFGLDGKPKWKQSYGEGWTGSHAGSRTTPTVDGDRLYVMSGHGRVACFPTAGGDEIWSVDTAEEFGGKNIRWGISESVLIDGDKVICTPGGPDASVVALDRKTGRTIWTSKGVSDKSAYCCPILLELGDNRLLITMLSNSVVCLDIETGKLHWQVEHTGKYEISAVSPVYHNGILYTTNAYGKGSVGYALSANGTVCEKKYEEKVLECHHGGVILLDGNVYGSNSREWVCLDIASGAVKYKNKLVGKGSGIYIDGLFYLYGEGGEMALVKGTSTGFQTISSFEIAYGDDKHWGHPVVSNGVLYIRHGNTLMAYDVKVK
jgi:outer membrane protein assembly factor BamB